MICEECGTKMLIEEGVVYTSYPQQYGYICPKCGHMQFSFENELLCNDKEEEPKINITINNVINITLNDD